MRRPTARTALGVLAASMAAATVAAAPALAAGSRWRVDAHPQPGGTDFTSFSSVFTASAAQAWAIGEKRASGSLNRTPLLEFWDGSRWTITSGAQGAGGPADELNSVGGTGPADVWAVGETTASSGISHGLIEHFNGSSWAVLPSPKIRNSDLAAVSADSPDDAWAAGSIAGNTPLAEHWNGTAWQVVKPVPNPCSSCRFTGFTSIDAISPTDVWALGAAIPQNYSGGRVSFLQHWDGSQWSLLPEAIGGDAEAISGTSPADVWAVGTGGLIEHFDGTTWTSVANPAGSGEDLGAVAALGPTDAWAVSSDGTLTEQWDGTGWAIVPSARKLPAGFRLGSGFVDSAGTALSGISGGPLFAVGGNTNGGNNRSTVLQQPEP